MDDDALRPFLEQLQRAVDDAMPQARAEHNQQRLRHRRLRRLGADIARNAIGNALGTLIGAGAAVLFANLFGLITTLSPRELVIIAVMVVGLVVMLVFVVTWNPPPEHRALDIAIRTLAQQQGPDEESK